MARILRLKSLRIEVKQRCTGIGSRFTASMYKVLPSLYFRILIVALVDFKRRFIDIEVGWPGSVGDNRVFKNSRLNNALNAWLEEFPKGVLSTGEVEGVTFEEEVPAFILADSAYANLKHLVTTFKTNECSNFVIAELNKQLGGARYRVENAFGILKGRFQIFQRPLACASENIEFAILLIGGCSVLHNFLIDIRDDSGDWAVDVLDEQNEGGIQEDPNAEPLRSATTREILIRHMKWTLGDDD